MNDHPQNPWDRSPDGQGWQAATPTDTWSQQSWAPQQPAQQPNRGWLWALLAVVLVLALTGVGAMAWLFGWFGTGGSSASGPVTSTYTSTVQVAPEDQADAPAAEPEEQQSEPVDDPPEGRGDNPVPAGSIPANSAARQNAATGDFNSVWRGTTVTSEPFANAVRDAFVSNYLETGDTDATLRVYSSVTGHTYTMTCRDNGSFVTCTGGNNAVVHIA